MKTISTKELFEKLGETKKVISIQKNQIIIYYKNGSVLFSYNTLLAAYLNYDYYFTSYHDYSLTTSKYVSKFCGYDAKTRRKMLEEELATYINN